MTVQSNSKYDFDQLAKSYDNWYNSVVGKMYDQLEKKALDNFVSSNNNGKYLLEIGCGTGHWSRYFSEKGFDVTGVDVSKEMIKKANEKNIPHCRF